MPRIGTHIGCVLLALLVSWGMCRADNHAAGAAMYTEGKDLIINSPVGGAVLLNGYSCKAEMQANKDTNAELAAKLVLADGRVKLKPVRVAQSVLLMKLLRKIVYGNRSIDS